MEERRTRVIVRLIFAEVYIIVMVPIILALGLLKEGFMALYKFDVHMCEKHINRTGAFRFFAKSWIFNFKASINIGKLTDIIILPTKILIESTDTDLYVLTGKRVKDFKKD